MGTILEPKLISQYHHQAQMPRDFITGLLHVHHQSRVIMPKPSTLNNPKRDRKGHSRLRAQQLALII